MAMRVLRSDVGNTSHEIVIEHIWDETDDRFRNFQDLWQLTIMLGLQPSCNGDEQANVSFHSEPSLWDSYCLNRNSLQRQKRNLNTNLNSNVLQPFGAIVTSWKNAAKLQNR